MSKAKKNTVADLEKRRDAMEQRISKLKADYSQAVIEGTDFDAAPIRDAEDERDAVNAAILTLQELAKIEAQREAERLEALTDEERRAGMAAGLRGIEATWIAEVKAMESHVRDFAHAYIRAMRAGGNLNVALMSQGTHCPDVLKGEIESRISGGMAAILAKATGKGSLGQMKLPSTIRDPELPWIEAEKYVRRDLAATVDRLLSNETEAA